MEFIHSSRGGQKLCLDGYMYTKQVTRKERVRWWCVKRVTNCKGAVSTSLQHEDVRIEQRHNHDSNPMEVEAAKAKANLKEQATQGRDPPNMLYTQALTTMPDDARVLMGKEASVKKQFVQRQRTKLIPMEPASIEDLVIDGEWAETANDTPQRFLIHDNGQNADSRIIVFASPTALRNLAHADTWMMDGNFAMAPRHFLQLYIIRVPLGNTAVTTVYALLQRKTQETYQDLIQIVLDHCARLDLYPDPITVLCDFEQAVISAVRVVLGEHVQVRGCFYHLTQSTWRKIQELGLVCLYNQNENVKVFCGMLDALALLPLPDVEEAVWWLKDNIPDRAEPLVAYFDRTYVTGTFRRAQAIPGQAGIRMRRIQPLFPPHLWNVHEATLNDEPRTNNLCEAWNNRFSNLVGHNHPSVWKLIEALKKDECSVSLTILQDARGQPPMKRVRKVYVELQQRLKTLCQARASGTKTVEEFLRGAGHNIRWKPVNNGDEQM